MKIAFVSDAVSPWHVGGLETVERTEAEELAKDTRNEVHFFAMRWPGMEKDFTENNVHFHTLMSVTREKFYRHGRRSIRTAVLFALSTFKIYLQKFDVVEANMFPILHIPIIKFYCKVRGMPLILDVVEVWEKKYWTEYLGRFLGTLAYWYAGYFLDSASAYITNSTVTAEGLRREGIDQNRLNTYAPVLDDALVRMVGSPRKRKLQIVFAGRFIKEKRLDKWLGVVQAVRAKVPSVKAVLIGSGPEAEGVRRMVREMGLGKVVEVRQFYGSKLDLYRAVAESSVFLQMSEREGLSIAALESIALGTPVVVPGYTPIPSEVRKMCMVTSEAGVPAAVAEVLKSGNASRFIRNKRALDQFRISRLPAFYSRLFRKLGLMG